MPRHPKVHCTERDLWAVLVAAVMADEFPETPLSIGYGSLETVGDTCSGTLHAAQFFKDAGVIRLDSKFTFRLTDHPFALIVKALAAGCSA